jgi:hypothetical protein
MDCDVGSIGYGWGIAMVNSYWIWPDLAGLCMNGMRMRMNGMRICKNNRRDGMFGGCGLRATLPKKVAIIA